LIISLSLFIHSLYSVGFTSPCQGEAWELDSARCRTLHNSSRSSSIPRVPEDLSASKSGVSEVLSNLIWLKMALVMAGVLDWVAFKGPFQPKSFCDSVDSMKKNHQYWLGNKS